MSQVTCIFWKKIGDIFQINSYSIRLLYITCYMRAKVIQSSPTPCNSMDHGLPGFSVHEILQEKLLEWVAMPRVSSQPRDQTCISYVPTSTMVQYLFFFFNGVILGSAKAELPLPGVS